MYLDQGVEPQSPGGLIQNGQRHDVQRRGDEQDAVGTQNPRLDELVLVDHEVLAQHRQVHGVACGAQVVVVALEVTFVGQH